MLNKKYSGVNDGKPYPVDRVAFKDGDDVSYLNVEDGKLELNGEPVGGGSGGIELVKLDIQTGGSYFVDKPTSEILEMCYSGKLVRGFLENRGTTSYFDISMIDEYTLCFYSIHAYTTERIGFCIIPIDVETGTGTMLVQDLTLTPLTPQ